MRLDAMFITEIDGRGHVLGYAAAPPGNTIFAQENIDGAEVHRLLRNTSNHQQPVDPTQSLIPAATLQLADREKATVGSWEPSHTRRSRR